MNTARSPENRLLHFDLSSGVAGDMLLGALIDLGCPVEVINNSLARLGISGLRVESAKIVRRGFSTQALTVHAPEGERLRHFHEVEGRIRTASFSTWVAERSLCAFRMIASAEAKIHNSTVEKVHFHEIGSLDTVADVVGVMSAVEYFGVREFSATPIAVGSGVVKIAHGAVNVPAPATAEILRGLPIDMTPLEGERTTPTGAAIIATLVPPESFTGTRGPGAIGCLVGAGYGAGTADFTDRVNMVRVLLIDLIDETPLVGPALSG